MAKGLKIERHGDQIEVLLYIYRALSYPELRKSLKRREETNDSHDSRTQVELKSYWLVGMHWHLFTKTVDLMFCKNSVFS